MDIFPSLFKRFIISNISSRKIQLVARFSETGNQFPSPPTHPKGDKGIIKQFNITQKNGIILNSDIKNIILKYAYMKQDLPKRIYDIHDIVTLELY